MARRRFPLAKVYRLLEPGPVVLITTAHRGRRNIMTLSWQTMMDFEPPLVGIVMGDQSFSFGLLRRSKQCVINIPTVELAKKVIAIGNCSGRNVDKFAAFGLTPRPAKLVVPPLIDECYACLECRVIDAHLATRYNFFVLEVLKAWVDTARPSPRTIHHAGAGNFIVDGRRLTLPSRMK